MDSATQKQKRPKQFVRFGPYFQGYFYSEAPAALAWFS